MKPVLDLPSSALETHAGVWRINDFYELTKPRMNLLIVITTLVGFYMASFGGINWLLLAHTLFGTALTAASAAVFNQLIERRHDARMQRTQDRPIAAGRVELAEATFFGACLGVGGVIYLAATVNVLTSILGAATWILYIALYTPLKRKTSLNTIIGAVPGALPPMMGYAAVQNTISIQSFTLFAILFLWQMPHFLAIAVMYRDDYAAAGFKMLPCDDPDLRLTIRMMLLYSAALIPISLLPMVQGSDGVFYFAAATALGTGFFAVAVRCALRRTRREARQLFFASIIYLPLLLTMMMIDKR